MKNLLILLISTSIFMAASCGDDQILGETADVNLNFKGTYGDDPLVCQNSDFIYAYPDGREIRFTSFEFFISEVSLVEEGGTDGVELIDIKYVNFTENTTAEGADSAISFPLNIPTGTYKGLKIGIGVPADLNNTSSSELSASHPLRKHGSFWSGWGSYIFTKIGGVYDIEGDGLANSQNVSITHHLGSDAMYKEIFLSKPIQLEKGDVLDLNIQLDARALYETGVDMLDLTDSVNQVTHDPENIQAATYMTSNYQQAFSIN